MFSESHVCGLRCQTNHPTAQRKFLESHVAKSILIHIWFRTRIKICHCWSLDKACSFKVMFTYLMLSFILENIENLQIVELVLIFLWCKIHKLVIQYKINTVKYQCMVPFISVIWCFFHNKECILEFRLLFCHTNINWWYNILKLIE
jgi:hypothetical protein